MSIIDLADKRKPVWYTIRIGHHWDDTLEMIVEGLADNELARASVKDTLQRFCGLQEPADAMHEYLLAEVDLLMDAKAGTPEGEKLTKMAALVEAYEDVRYEWNTIMNQGKKDRSEHE
jgi:hypothetical protein